VLLFCLLVRSAQFILLEKAAKTTPSGSGNLSKDSNIDKTECCYLGLLNKNLSFRVFFYLLAQTLKYGERIAKHDYFRKMTFFYMIACQTGLSVLVVKFKS